MAIAVLLIFILITIHIEKMFLFFIVSMAVLKKDDQ